MRARSRVLLLAMAVGAVAVLATLWWIRRTHEIPFQTTSTDQRVQKAYEIARAIPDALAAVECHCGCMRNKLSHDSNLDCFRNSHAETCWQCVAIAHDVDRYVKEGRSMDWIKRYVRNVYTFDEGR